MQEQQKVKMQPKLKRSSIGKVIILFWRSRKHPEALEELIKLIESVGASEEDIAFIQELHATARAASLDDKTYLIIDRYLVGGIAVINLILLPIILSMGVHDPWLKFSLYTLVVSLPLAAGSLFYSFLKKESGTTTYGKIHSALSALSLLTGIAAMTLLLCHVSLVAGILFFCLVIVVYSLCSGYAVIFLFEKHSLRKFLDVAKIAMSKPHTPTSDNTKEEN